MPLRALSNLDSWQAFINESKGLNKRKRKFCNVHYYIILPLTRVSRASIQLPTIARSPKNCVSDKVEKRKKASETDDASEGTVINKVNQISNT